MKQTFRITWALIFWGIVSPIVLDADVVRLKNGGEIRGSLDRPKAADEEKPLEIVSLSGIRLRIDRADVEFYVIRSPRVEEYETRESQALDSVEDQWALARWCARQKLEKQERRHLERVVALDPDHEQARKLLDHVKYKGAWIPRDEMMRQKGYVKYKLGYITQQEMMLIQEKEAEKELSREWYNRMKKWQAYLYSDTPQKSQSAVSELRDLRDPEAVPALVYYFAHHADSAARNLMLDILNAIDSEAAKVAIARQAIQDESSDLRLKALRLIPEKYTLQASALFIEYLDHSDNKIVNRAGRALQEVASQEAIPALVEALITTHQFTIHIPVQEGVTFTSNGNQLGSGAVPANIEALARAGQLPYGYQVNPPLGMPTQAGVQWKPVNVRKSLKNAQVLAALEALTEESFGYDQRSWRLWVAARKNQGQSLFADDGSG